MKIITAENVPYYYFSKGEGKPQLQDMNVIRHWHWTLSKWETVIEPDMYDIRPILFDLVGTYGLYFLHWDDGIDLEHLDAKIDDDTYVDEDFNYAMPGEFTTLICLGCRWRGYALQFDHGLAHRDAPGLFKTKFRTRYDRKGFLGCPRCGEPFRISIVKIFDFAFEEKD